MPNGPANRIIDANANRAREALRVMEDAARFVLDDAALCGRLKSIRHGLAEALAVLSSRTTGVPPVSPIAWRDTPGDVGTAISTPSEMSRASVRDVVIAAGKRLSEALRSIEEYAKVPGVGGTAVSSQPCAANDASTAGGMARSMKPSPSSFEQLRYEGYEAERLLTLAMGAAREGFRGWKLCVLITESLCTHHPWLEVAKRAIAGGADCIQLREKSLESAELLRRARLLVEFAHSGPTSPAIIINDRPDIALLSGADGVHLGQTDLPVHEARKIIGFDMLVGVSTENIDQARAARSAGADYSGVGPMFATTTKDKPRLAGPAYLREYLGVEPALPACLAIGGITAARMPELRAAAADHRLGERWGVAVSSAVCGASDPEAVCRRLSGG